MAKQLTILIIGLLFLVGCRGVGQGDVVTSVEWYKQWKNSVYYHTDHGGIWGPKGLYNIGDTVKFCK